MKAKKWFHAQIRWAVLDDKHGLRSWEESAYIFQSDNHETAFEQAIVLSPKKNGPRYERLGGSGELIFSVMPAAVFEPLAAHCVIS